MRIAFAEAEDLDYLIGEDFRGDKFRGNDLRESLPCAPKARNAVPLKRGSV
jgi:hypothetical protein